jgi:hypothetical protein
MKEQDSSNNSIDDAWSDTKNSLAEKQGAAIPLSVQRAF